jgi:hypothetical protein
LVDPAEAVANVRRLSGIPDGRGPTNDHIANAVRGFAEVFDYWYIRVMKEAVAKYRTLLIQRINPFIRRIQYEGADCSTFATKLVEDYNTRNFVTAGGWALEQLALKVNPEFQKSAARGIDLQRHNPSSGEYHLYVLKSGLVTRNSDIVNALKRNSRDAEKLLRQSGSKAKVNLNYAIAAGKTTSTFEDGVRRPSSAEFWSEVMKLPEQEAVELALAIAAEAGRLVRSDASQHANAMKVLLQAYLADASDSSKVDWGFLKRRNFQPKAAWAEEDKRRHKAALASLAATGYTATQQVAEEAQREDSTPQEEIEAGDPPEDEKRLDEPQ